MGRAARPGGRRHRERRRMVARGSGSAVGGPVRVARVAPARARPAARTGNDVPYPGRHHAGRLLLREHVPGAARRSRASLSDVRARPGADRRRSRPRVRRTHHRFRRAADRDVAGGVLRRRARPQHRAVRAHHLGGGVGAWHGDPAVAAADRGCRRARGLRIARARAGRTHRGGDRVAHGGAVG